MIALMLLRALLAATDTGARAGAATPPTFTPPRLEEAGTRVDGTLDEAVWTRAARLSGFSQFYPQDGSPASDSTEVLVWYSANAIHFGIRAFESHGRAQATLADRDRIASDDQIQLFLGTQGEARRAYVFGVNPLGVQMDGVLLESNQNRTGDFVVRNTTREAPDLSPDFVFQSKGRLTESGYEVEVRIPFKSLKFQSKDRQSWSLNVLRLVQHLAEEDTWAPVKQGSTSFLDQSGVLEGLTDLRRGLVLDLNPDATVRTTSAAAPGVPLGAGYDRTPSHAAVGVTARWGVTTELTANATVHPDFSQVESDAPQLVGDPRFALYFAEKRPFFLDGLEQFETPHSLVYTRRIVQPVAAAKLTGSMAGLSIAALSAVDDRIASTSGRDRPLVNVLRAVRATSLGRVGVTYTDRKDGRAYNRVADIDARWASGPYSVLAQYAHSFTGDAARSLEGPLWQVSASANTRSFGARYALDAVSDDFRTQAGFIGRGGVSSGIADHRFTWFGPTAGLLQSVTFNPVVLYNWRYGAFLRRADALEKKLHLNLQTTLRGGWGLGFSYLPESFAFDSALYRDYTVDRGATATHDTIPFVGRARIPNRDWVVSINTPQWRWGSAYLLHVWGQDENFFEWASSNVNYVTFGATLRPTPKLRIDGEYTRQSFNRPGDRSIVAVNRVPRVKAEYQLARPIFVRAIGQFVSTFQDALRDVSGTGLPLLIDGKRTTRGTTGRFRGEYLFSYQPTPGTVFFAGYGANYADTHADPATFRFPQALALNGYRRQDDVLFVKASYLFRF